MDFDEAFGPEVTHEEFFLEKLPQLHEEKLDLFATYCETTLRLCIRLEDLDRTFSVELAPDGARAIEGEFIDFPVVTLEGETGNWDLVKKHARRLFEKGEEALKRRPPNHKISRAFLDDLERYDGVLNVTISGESLDDPIEVRAILNDYQAPPRAREVDVTLSVDLVDQVAEGDKGASEAADALSLGRDVTLAFDLGGLMMNHFPDLEG